MSVAGFVQTWGPLVGGALVGVLPWIRLWRDGREAGGRRRADLIQIAQAAASSVISELREEADRLRERVSSLEGALRDMQRRLDRSADSLAAKDAEIALLRRRLRQALALTADDAGEDFTEHS
jgi:transposase-like protein